ncbi:MAG TPA: response regulator [Elusimicrobiota bacterium]|nr:response regulator [Elusimicrobiota bacterium]
MRHAKPVIAMVDDEVDYMTLIRNWLEDDYVFYAFKSGEEFLTALPALSPDLVILDLYLRGVDGIELCRRMRELKKFSGVPVLFLTGSERIDDYRRSLCVGGTTYLTKPVGRTRLLSALTDLLPQPALRDEGGGD